MTDAEKALDRIEQTGFIALTLTRTIRAALKAQEKPKEITRWELTKRLRYWMDDRSAKFAVDVFYTESPICGLKIIEEK